MHPRVFLWERGRKRSFLCSHENDGSPCIHTLLLNTPKNQVVCFIDSKQSGKICCRHIHTSTGEVPLAPYTAKSLSTHTPTRRFGGAMGLSAVCYLSSWDIARSHALHWHIACFRPCCTIGIRDGSTPNWHVHTAGDGGEVGRRKISESVPHAVRVACVNHSVLGTIPSRNLP